MEIFVPSDDCHGPQGIGTMDSLGGARKQSRILSPSLNATQQDSRSEGGFWICKALNLSSSWRVVHPASVSRILDPLDPMGRLLVTSPSSLILLISAEAWGILKPVLVASLETVSSPSDNLEIRRNLCLLLILLGSEKLEISWESGE